MFNTRSARLVGSRRAAKGEEPTARVEGAILFHSLGRGYLISGAWARGMLPAAESALRELREPCVLVSLFPDSPDNLWDQDDWGGCIKEEIGPIMGQRVPDLRIICRAVKAVFGGEKIYFGPAKDLPNHLNRLWMETTPLKRRALRVNWSE